MNRLTLDLLWCMVQVTLVSAAASAVYVLIRNRSVQLRTALLQTTFALVTALSLLALSPWPSWRSAETSVAEQPIAAAPAARGESIAGAKGEREPFAAALPAELADQSEPQSPMWGFFAQWLSASGTPTANETASEAPPSRSFSWSGLFCAVVIGVIAVRLITLLVRVWQVAALRRSSTVVSDPLLLQLRDQLCHELGCTVSPQLRVSSRICTAAATGWLRPVILLSPEFATWTPAQLRGIMAHEIAHLRSYDPLAVLSSELALAFHFYHPLLHWLNGRLHLEQEFQADATAARTIGGEQPYLRVLAQLALAPSSAATSAHLSTFLASQSPLLRRIEMLKQPQRVTTASRPLRLGLVGLMVLLALAAAGLRTPAGPRLLAQETPRDAAPGAGADTGRVGAEDDPLAWVPESAPWLVNLRLDEIRKHEDFKRLLNDFDDTELLRRRFGLATSQIRKLQVFGFPADPYGGGAGVIIHSTEPLIPADVIRNIRDMAVNPEPLPGIGGASYYSYGGGRLAFPAPHVMLLADIGPDAMDAMVKAGSVGASESRLAQPFKQVGGSPLSVIALPSLVRESIERELAAGGPTLTGMIVLSPLWRDAETIAIGISVADTLNIQADVVGESEEGAARIAGTLQAAAVLGQNALAGMKRALANAPPEQQEISGNLIAFVEPLLQNVQPQQEGDRVTISIQSDAMGVAKTISILVPAVTAAKTASRRMQSYNNLKNIALAFHNYHAIHNRLPAAAVIGPDGETPHSWRVALLPLLGEQELYDQYRLDEPWDSEHNQQLIQRIPNVFRHPMDAAGSTNSGYFVLVGEHTLFGNPAGTPFADVVDGVSTTLMAVAAKKDIPWTKPEDIAYDAEQKIPDLGGFFSEGFEVARADGSVIFMSKTADAGVLRSLIDISDQSRR